MWFRTKIVAVPREAGVMMFYQTASVRDAANQELLLAVDDASRTREMTLAVRLRETCLFVQRACDSSK